MLRVAYAKDEIDDFRSALLPLFHSLWRIGMWAQALIHTRTALPSCTDLSKDTAAVRKGISDGCSKLPQY